MDNTQMKTIFDVHYSKNEATVGCVTFKYWEEETSQSEIIHRTKTFSEYKPGEFYKRELPCILSILEQFQSIPSIIIIDGYVTLATNQPGLGTHLFNKLNKKVPVIGVAKNKFKACSHAIEILRGNSKKPLYITSAGMNLKKSSLAIQSMHGKYRIPTLLKRADQISRSI